MWAKRPDNSKRAQEGPRERTRERRAVAEFIRCHGGTRWYALDLAMSAEAVKKRKGALYAVKIRIIVIAVRADSARQKRRVANHVICILLKDKVCIGPWRNITIWTEVPQMRCDLPRSLRCAASAAVTCVACQIDVVKRQVAVTKVTDFHRWRRSRRKQE